MCCDSPDPPDYSATAAASVEAAKIMGDLGRDQLAFEETRYNEAKPIFERIVNSQMDAQDEQMRQGRDYYDYAKETFRPLEKGVVADAQEFNTDEYRNQIASRAAADSGRAFGLTRQANERAMASMGVNPNSGKFQGLGRQSALQQAGSRAGAMTGARERAEQTGFARKLDAAGLGRNLAGSSTAAYGSAINAGNSAGTNQLAPGNAYSAGMSAGAKTIGSGQNMQIQGLGSVLNAQTQYALGNNDSFLGDLGGLVGAGASMYSAGMFPSDPRLKENIKEVGFDGRTDLTLYEFNYKGLPDRRFRGVMADEVEARFPDAVTVKDGFKAVYYDKLGLEFKEVF